MGIISRRKFISEICASTMVLQVDVAHSDARSIDRNLSVFVSDMHVGMPGFKTRWGEQPAYQNVLFAKTVDEILSLNPRPARVIVFGDIALWFGFEKDYELSRPIVKRLTDVGIDVVLTTGNHDHREPMSRIYPEQFAKSPVPGRYVSVVDLGLADLILLDSLDENKDGEGSQNNGNGVIDEKQRDWLWTESARRKRPFFVGAHQHPAEIKGENIVHALSGIDDFCGFIHGHNHVWSKTWIRPRGGNRLRRIVGLPSTGWWGDIGFALMRTESDRAVLTLKQNDFFCRRPLGSRQCRPQDWDAIVMENQGQTATFFFCEKGNCA